MLWGRGLSKISRAFLQDDSGQAISEYILLLSFVVVGVGALMRALYKAMEEGVQIFGGQLEKDLKTGRVDVNIWKN